MSLSNLTAGLRARRLMGMPGLLRWSLLCRIVPAALALTLTGLAGAQGYPQQYPNPNGDPNQDQNAQGAQQDPPSRVARLSLAQGTVSLEPASVQEFSPAEVNYPLTTGDRLWVDTGAFAELQFGQAAVRLGQGTDFTVTGLTDTLAQFGLAQGSVHLHTFVLEPNTSTELDTPNGAVTVLAPGDVRVDVYPGNDTTVITLLSGAAQVDAQGFSQQLQPGEALQLSGANPVYAQDVRRARPDGLDSFSAGQDSAYEAAVASESSFLNTDTIGVADLGNYGDWSADPDYGAVWYPRSVGFGWQPYHNGHWAWIAPWGWTWIESEPWGFAPFHYGRWGQFRGRWGWVPGPAPVRPIYSPALVVFVGGGEHFGGGPGGGVTAWFPLGPREPFQPWYHASDRYVTQVNVTNIYNRNTVEVRNIYAGRGPSPFQPDPGRQYVNRPLATVAVPQAAFAAGRPVQGAALRVDAHVFDSAPILPHPLVSPTRAMVAPGPARALPPQMARPELQTRGFNPPVTRQAPPEVRTGGQQGYPSYPSGGQPGNPGGQQGYPGGRTQGYPNGGQPGSPGGSQPAPINRTSPIGGGNGTIAPTLPQQPRYTPPQATHEPSQQTGEQRAAPVQPQPPIQRVPGTPPPSMQTQPGQGNPGYHGPVGPQRGTQPETMAPQAPGRPAATPPAPAERPLINRAEPPQQRPSFEQQREVMEHNDPGRPLAPQQMNNLQGNRPAGPPPQREAIPHPAAAPPPPPSRQPPPAPAPKPK